MKGLKFPATIPERVADALAILDGERLEHLYDFLKANEERIRQMSRSRAENRKLAIRKQREQIVEAREEDPDLPRHDACLFDGSDKAMDYLADWSYGVLFPVSTGTVGCRKVLFRADPSDPVCPETVERGNYVVCNEDYTFCQMTPAVFAEYSAGKKLDVWRP